MDDRNLEPPHVEAGPRSARRAEAARAIQRQRELYRLLIENVTDYAIFALDPTGHIASWNPGAQRLKGYTAAEIIGQHFSIFYPEEDVRSGKPERELEVATAEGRVEDEGWRVRKDGSRFWANVIITALRDQRGQLVGFGKVTRDLTERRAAETQARRLAAEEAGREAAERLSKELEDANGRLRSALAEAERAQEAAHRARADAESANAAKMQFLAVMSHELRTPLNAIAGYAELIKMGLRGPVTQEQGEDLDRIVRSEQALLGLVNDVLNYAKIESGHAEFDLTDVVVAKTLAEVEALVLPQLQAKGLAFHSSPCQATVRVRADPDKLRQIVLNLLSNAIKFTEPGGTISVLCAAAGRMVCLSVRDTGLGIPTEKLDAVFEPFVQVDAKLTREHQGTGLGLAIGRDLARAMGGNLTVQSELGKGSTFALVLPRATDGA